MRRGILALSAALLAAGCGEEQAVQDSGQADQVLARDPLETNDLTAIDAASGADFNMAADLDIANMALDEEDDGPDSAQRRPAPASRRSTASNPPPVEQEEGPTPSDSPPEAEDGAN